MTKLRTFASRLAALFRKRRLEQEMNEELRAHLEMLVETNIQRGMSREEARYAALREFGGVDQTKEIYREQRGLLVFETLWQDLRFSLRVLGRNGGFTLVAVVSLALGIGGNAAVFSLVDGVLLRPLPYANPEKLVRVTGYYPTGGFLALNQLSRTMEVATYSDKPENGSEFNLAGEGEAMHLTGSVVSANIFSLLGAGAELGRVFQPGDDRPGSDRLVLLSHALWESKFHADSNVLGRVVKVNGVDRIVVGVMPPDFNFLIPDVQLWVPLHIDPALPDENWGHGFKPLVGRLRPGASLAQAENEIKGMIAEIIPMFPYPMAKSWNSDATVLPLQRDLVGDVRAELLVLLGAVALVLLIACVNVASLLLSLAAARRKEIALRAALGAARGRIVRQLLTESVVLGLAGGGLGVALAFAAIAALKSVLPAGTPRIAEVGMDWRVLAFITALSILSGMIFGLVPALRSSNLNMAHSMKASGQRSTDTAGINLRSSFIVVEVGLAVVLVVGAGLLIRTLWRLMQVNPGFRGESVLTVRVTPDPSSCRERAACIALYDHLLSRAAGLADVSDVAASNTVPLSGEAPYVVAEVEGHPLQEGKSLAPLLWAGAITPDYFRIMGVPLLEGRTFSDSDADQSGGVVIVSAATALHYWPGENPMGKHIRFVWDKDWRTVVGVAGDVRQFNLADVPLDWLQGAIYMPYAQSVDASQNLPANMYLIARTSADPARFAGEIHTLVAGVNPNLPVSEVRTMRAIVGDSASPSRALMWLFVAFAGTALMLAAIGTYGVVSYSTAQRTFEIGMRVALGATRRDILRLVIGQSLRLVVVGLALGLAASWVLARLLTSFLYGVTATDPATLLAVTALLMAVALIAGLVPARRATKVDPMAALRCE